MFWFQRTSCPFLLVLSKVAFFLWVAALGNILTIENGKNLWRRNITSVSRCHMCKRDEETVDHLLLHCPMAIELWGLVFALFGVKWVMTRKVVDLLACWQGSFGCHQSCDIWRFIPHCLMGCIWWKRNARSFEGCGWTTLELKAIFLKTLLIIFE